MSSPKRTSSHRKGHSQSGSRRDHRNSDSGFAQDYSAQSSSPAALQEALRASNLEVKYWRAKHERADAEVTARNKEIREQKSHWQGLYDRSAVLEDRIKELETENKRLKHENEVFRDDLTALRQQRKSPSPDLPPVMSGGAGGRHGHAAVPPPLARTMSASKRTAEKEHKGKEREEKDQKKRLSQRLNRDDSKQQAAAGPPPTSSSQGRYVEAWGPGGRPSRRSSSVTPPASRGGGGAGAGGFNYTTTGEPVYASPRQPTFSSVPRNYASERDREPEPYGPGAGTGAYREDGTYQNWPLPEQPRHGHRGRRP